MASVNNIGYLGVIPSSFRQKIIRRGVFIGKRDKSSPVNSRGAVTVMSRDVLCTRVLVLYVGKFL